MRPERQRRQLAGARRALPPPSRRPPLASMVGRSTTPPAPEAACLTSPPARAACPPKPAPSGVGARACGGRVGAARLGFLTTASRQPLRALPPGSSTLRPAVCPPPPQNTHTHTHTHHPHPHPPPPIHPPHHYHHHRAPYSTPPAAPDCAAPRAARAPACDAASLALAVTSAGRRGQYRTRGITETEAGGSAGRRALGNGAGAVAVAAEAARQGSGQSGPAPAGRGAPPRRAPAAARLVASNALSACSLALCGGGGWGGVPASSPTGPQGPSSPPGQAWPRTSFMAEAACCALSRPPSTHSCAACMVGVWSRPAGRTRLSRAKVLPGSPIAHAPPPLVPHSPSCACLGRIPCLLCSALE